MKVALGLVEFACLLSSLWVVLVVEVEAGDPNKSAEKYKQSLLKSVCRNAQVPIESVEEAKRLIDEVWADTENKICLKKYTQSFFDLENILEEDGETSLCSASRFELIRKYHFRYINPPREVYKFGDNLQQLKKEIQFRQLDAYEIPHTIQLDEFGQVILIPIAVQQFFKAYALQVSGVCKRTMAENLEMAMSRLSDDDHELMEIHSSPSHTPTESPQRLGTGKLLKGGKKLTRNKAMKRMLNSASPGEETAAIPNALIHNRFKYDLNFKNLVYMPELEGELDDGDLRRQQEVTLIDLRHLPELNNFMQHCELRFKPVYSKLVMPVVRLAKLGYEYFGPELKKYQDTLDSDSAVKLMVVTMACEAFGKFKLAGEPPAVKRFDYTPTLTSSSMGGPLWIRGPEQLSKEFARVHEKRATGVRKFLYDVRRAFGKTFAALDPHHMEWYRRNKDMVTITVGSISFVFKISNLLGR